ncbi:solute carrier family 22 member 3-like isoform X1 [Lepisosteus oculatus]|uniref:solute carrier family 22 member 3-like isoform X1 n=1 Tax=Lepisosteus oculatus TaxID=7918 RepID=UPI0035F5297A
MPTFDELLVDIGELGPYQKRVFLLGCIPGILFAFSFVGIVFLGNTPEHWCRNPKVEGLKEKCGWSKEELKNYTIPRSDKGSFSQCERFDVDWNSTDLTCSSPVGFIIANSSQKIPLTACNEGWEFDGSRSTIVSEYELVCEDAWKADLNQAFLNMGYLLGAIVIGYGADRFGRKVCFLFSIFGLALSGVGTIFSPNYTAILVFRAIQGIFGKGAWMTSYVLVTEIVSSRYRRLVGIVAQLFFTIGVIILPGIAYLIPSWKMLQLVITLPCSILLLYYWFIPESPRWLLTLNRTKEAMEIAEHIAKRNGRNLPEKYREMELSEPVPERAYNPSPLDVFRTPHLRKFTFILMYAWFASSVVYQGLVMRIGIIKGNLYLEFFISGIVELPSALIFYLTIDRIGRRIPFVLSNIVGGLSCLITAFIPTDMTWLKTFIAVIGRLGITLGYEIVYIVSTELYPTPLRNIGLSLTSSLSDVGGIVAPFLLYRLASFWIELPMLLYGVMALVYGGLVLLLPETKGIDLPETTEDVEALGKDTKVIGGLKWSCLQKGLPDHKEIQNCATQLTCSSSQIRK